MYYWRQLSFVLLISAFIVTVSCFSASAMEGRMARSSLAGLDGVGVVCNIKPETEKAGLTAERIKVYVKSKLHAEGIKMLTPEECFRTAGNPNLFVGIAYRELKNAMGYYYTINIAMIQDVYIARDKTAGKYPAKTWTTEYFGVTYDLNHIRSKAGEQLDKFITAYAYANRK